MNNLNSVLIEGTLKEDPVEKDGICRFTIEVYRYYKQDDGDQKQETLNISVETHGKLTETCIGYLKKDSGVRVVGRISQDSDSNLIIYAEHVEFKPIKKI